MASRTSSPAGRRLAAAAQHLRAPAAASAGINLKAMAAAAGTELPDVPAGLTAEQRYEIDLRGYTIVRQHFGPDAIAALHRVRLNSWLLLDWQPAACACARCRSTGSSSNCANCCCMQLRHLLLLIIFPLLSPDTHDTPM